VQARRGRVLQYAGDNILVAFGADEAREDDAERAVCCGLALLDLGTTLGAEVLAAHDHAGLNVRVGRTPVACCWAAAWTPTAASAASRSISPRAWSRPRRQIAIGRSNWLFAGSLRGGQRAAAVMSQSSRRGATAATRTGTCRTSSSACRHSPPAKSTNCCRIAGCRTQFIADRGPSHGIQDAAR